MAIPPRRLTSRNILPFHDRPLGPFTVFVEKACPHQVEILTRAQWVLLDERDSPGEFIEYTPDCFFRIRPLQ